MVSAPSGTCCLNTLMENRLGNRFPEIKEKGDLVNNLFNTNSTYASYMTTGKTISLTKRTLVGKVMSLLLNMLPRLVIT